jgi:hypothetical protein
MGWKEYPAHRSQKVGIEGGFREELSWDLMRLYKNLLCMVN